MAEIADQIKNGPVDRPRVVIVGGGFGGVRVVRALRKTNAEVLLIDKRNYHLFQPLLYQVATATLNPSQIAVPLRYGVEQQSNCAVFMLEVTGIDPSRNIIQIGLEKKEFVYDYLVLAAGCDTNYFGNEEWRSITRGLKSLEDALKLRQEFLLAFERAETQRDLSHISEVLTFVVVGGGPTGVELAGAMSELTRYTLKKSFRRISAADAKIVLIDSGTRLLKSFPEECSNRAQKDLEGFGVEIILGARVIEVNPESVTLRFHDGAVRVLKSTHVTWAAGVTASPLGKCLGASLDPSGRVEVTSDLSILNHPNVYVIGDTAKYVDPKTQQQVPGVAQGAIQMGDFVGRNLAKTISGYTFKQKPIFRYFDNGSMATIGRGKAVVAAAGFRFYGFIAWLMWAFVHSFYLLGFRNQISTLITWIVTYRSYARGVRLITGEIKDDLPLPLPDDPRLVAPAQTSAATNVI